MGWRSHHDSRPDRLARCRALVHPEGAPGNALVWVFSPCPTRRGGDAGRRGRPATVHGTGSESPARLGSILHDAVHGRASRAIGSVVERLVHTEEVTGSNPVSPTASPQVSGASPPGPRRFLVFRGPARVDAVRAAATGARRTPHGRARHHGPAHVSVTSGPHRSASKIRQASPRRATDDLDLSCARPGHRPAGPGADVEGAVRPMADVAFIALTVVLFAAIALVARRVDRS